MVTYENLFLFGTLLIAIISLVYNMTKKELTAQASKTERLNSI